MAARCGGDELFLIENFKYFISSEDESFLGARDVSSLKMLVAVQASGWDGNFEEFHGK